MTTKVNPIPDGFHTLQPVINVDNIDAVISFVKEVFGAVEKDRFNMPDGSTIHVEVKIGDSILILGPVERHGSFPAKIFVYVDDVDTVYSKALAAGAKSVSEPEDQFFGQRVARAQDSWGNLWVIATQTEIVNSEEMQRRFKTLMNSQ